MDIRILGPLEVLDEGRALELGGAKQRAVLALLALNANRVVSVDRIAQALWDDNPPESARKAVQVYVSQLRKTLGRERVQTKGSGYLLRVEPDELDLARFQRLRDEGELDAALALWRGESEVAWLEDLRLGCLEERIDRELAAGRHAEIVGELEALARAQSLRERVRAQLMLALYRSGRQADALEAYRVARDAFADELGIEPGRELRDLHQRILQQDPALDLARADPAPPPPAQSASAAVMRKTVTVLFCDLADSTQLGERLDPEALRTVMSRWFEAMRAPIERSGGTVEKFVGDAVMAVFGIPAVHEDDAFRAVRAAVEMRDAAETLELQVRIGVNTGEVITGDGRTTLVTGDAVNTAKRLEEAAAPDEILIGGATHKLVAHAAETEPTAAVAAKGKSEPVEAWRVLGTIAGATPVARRLDARLVGRRDELAVLVDAFEAAASERSCRLVTVTGAAGIGKSRLAHELVERLAGRARVLSTRCLPYGDGVTLLPLRELIGDIPDGTTDEVFAEVRRRLQAEAADRPLLVRIEDVHWAAPTFLDLVEYLAGWLRAAPVFIVCLARPELYDERPRWPGVAIALEALTDVETGEMLEELAAEWPVTPDERARIGEIAEGNPLFLEQLVAMVADAGTTPMPPTIQALLTARLDRLAPFEQAVLQRGAVAGREFSLSAVADLTPNDERGDVAATLLALVRKEFIRPAPERFPSDDGFRFRHALIRDAAYAEIPKRTRAELHERFADWIAARGAANDLVGYHLEQAALCREEIGDPDRSLSARAGRLLAAAGSHAFSRDDVRAARNLLERAAQLLPDGPARAEVLILLGSTYMNAGDFTNAKPVLAEAQAIARAHGDRRLDVRAGIELAFQAVFTGDASSAEMTTVAEEAIPPLEALGDDFGLSRAWRLMSEPHIIACHWGDAASAMERSIDHARRAGDRRQESSLIGLLAQALLWGPTPVHEAIVRCERFLADAGEDNALAAALMSPLGALYAMRGEFERARLLWHESRDLYEKLGLRHRRATRSLIGGLIELLAGDAEAAEREVRLGYDTLSAMGETYVRATLGAYLAAILAELGRDAEAIELTRESEANAAADDISTEVVWLGARARALARGGDPDTAVQLARDAVRRAEATDFSDLRAGALLDLAAVSGDADAAARAVEEYERKGNVVGAARARALVTV
ncbi:MAG TPA: BTAD domain-containing putative transcriptional regulator [Gaiellaceae bacterium]|nr:BTAD domain-containing putative transcriptional regulator [Gaiellaceae bacterium]